LENEIAAVASKYANNLQEKKMPTPEQKNELVSYLKIRLKYIRDCATLLEGFLDAEYKRYALQSDNNKLTPEMQEVLHDIEYGLTLTFRYCMLVAVCSYVEDSLKKIGELVVSDYSQKIKSDHSHDSWFRKHLRVLESDAKIDFTAIESDISLFEDIITVRNAIVHTWGKVDEVKNPAKLETIIENKKKKYGTNNWIEKTANGYIFLNDLALPNAKITATNIVRHVLTKSGLTNKD
jgi:hypothetical protein